MNLIPQETFEVLKRLFKAGASIREAVKQTGVGRHTAMRYKRMYNGQSTPPLNSTPKGLGISPTEGLCHYMPQSERKALWVKLEGSIPEGKRLGSSCRLPYCGFLEHMCLVEDKTTGWINWRQRLGLNRLYEIPVGDFIEIESPPQDQVGKLRTILCSFNVPIAVRTSADRQTIKIYRVAEKWELGRMPKAAHDLAIRLPSPLGGVELPPEVKLERHMRAVALREERLRLRTARTFERQMRAGAPSIWLGQFRQTPDDVELLSRPRWSSCSVKGCPYPHNGSDKCRYHGHFFDFKWSMEWRAIGYSDVHPTETTPIPLFSSMQAWELPRSAERTVFDHNGTRDKGRKLSEDYWREHVEKYQAQAAANAGKVHVRVIGEPKPQYAPEDKITNVQHTGAFVLWKGFGRKKIRKVQRKRAQQVGWHGNHPEQKPRDSFSRDTLEDVPMWAPQSHEHSEVQNEDIYLDDYTPMFADEEEFSVES